jgi:nickel-dependent lactate racemase
MANKSDAMATVLGKGSPESDLSNADLSEIVTAALANMKAGARILAIVPDKTRDDNTDVLLPLAAQALSRKAIAKFDVLIAQGTHAPMTAEQKRRKIGADRAGGVPGLGEIFDHDWANPGKLITIGELSREKMKEISGGLIDGPVRLSINSLLAPGLYDVVLIFGATTPHEVAGFSGGAKYFFPGVGGPELTHATHWLGALATIENVIGRVETPTRHLFEAGADFVAAQVISFNSVVTRGTARLRTHALFCGDFRQALRRAAEVSRHVHIKYTGRKYPRVVALLDEHYDDLWVGGKASYRLGPIVEAGGNLIIYAPHLRCISDTHGDLIRRYGYAPLEKIKQLVALSPELQQNLCVAAHLAHVSFAGRENDKGETVHRYTITLASAVSEAECHQVNLGYLNPQDFKVADYSSDPNTLIVEQAGRDLYLVDPLTN